MKALKISALLILFFLPTRIFAQIDTSFTIEIEPTSTKVILSSGLTDSSKIQVSNTSSVPLIFCVGGPEMPPLPCISPSVIVEPNENKEFTINQLGGTVIGANLKVTNSSLTSQGTGVVIVTPPCTPPVWTPICGAGDPEVPNTSRPLMYLSPTGAYVGIGTTLPEDKLHVVGRSRFTDKALFTDYVSISNGIHSNLARLYIKQKTSSDTKPLLRIDDFNGGVLFTVENSGLVNATSLINANGGINTNYLSTNYINPTSSLEIEANNTIQEPFRIKRNNYYFYVGVNRNGNDYVDIGAHHTTGGAKNLIINRSGGKVGIATESYPLTANLNIGTTGGTTRAISVKDYGTEHFVVYGDGRIYGRGLWLTATTFPDYVFEKDYKLMSLYDLQAYINTHKHLPNIPSAKEVEETGKVDIGGLQIKMLEKIEELTLYVIDLKKENDLLKEEINKIKAQIGN